jgi:transcriptional regulator with XRE-family HTH domain
MVRGANFRKDRFRAALLLAGITGEEFAARHGITLGHLSHVLSGKRDSRSLIEKVEAFTKEQIILAALQAA